MRVLLMENFIQDLRYGVRVLLKSPGFTAVAVIALALGIGANTAVFSVVNAVLLKPLPYKDSDRLVLMTGASLETGQLRGSVSPPDFLDYREQNTTLERLAAVAGASFSLTGGPEPERVQSARVSEGFFEALGVGPAYGRTFASEEEQSGRDQVVILGNGLWRRRFGADPNVLGQTITLNDKSYLVVGVMPEGFQYPRDAELWVPFAFKTPQTSVRRFHYLRPVGRLKQGVSLQQAQADLTSIARRLAEQYPTRTGIMGRASCP
jgi:predicted permease